MTMKTTISDNQLKVLRVLSECSDDIECNCVMLAEIGRRAGLERRVARLATRALARKGYTKLERGLVKLGQEEELAGSAYCATKEGVLFYNSLPSKL